VPLIPQRELRNQVSSVLRRVEQGERFTVTVGGRPVAELGPLPGARTPASPERLAVVFAEAPVDDAWAAELAELREADATAGRDPWAA
jgi:prevent-host-death family protein